MSMPGRCLQSCAHISSEAFHVGCPGSSFAHGHSAAHPTPLMANRVAPCPAVVQPRSTWYRQISFICHSSGERKRQISQTSLCQARGLLRLPALHPRRSDWYICSGPLLVGEPILVCFGQYSHHMRKGILVQVGILYRLTKCRLASAQHLVVGPRSCCRIIVLLDI